MTDSFEQPVNLPHAALVTERTRHRLHLDLSDGSHVQLGAIIERLDTLLAPTAVAESHSEQQDREPLYCAAADLARALVFGIEELGLGDPGIGQAARKLFECLALGREGAALSLRAGESPDSPQRPR